MVFEVLDNILSESNQASFDSLQEVGVGSQSVLINAESFGLFAARVLAMDQKMEASQTINITGENMGMAIIIYLICSVQIKTTLCTIALRAQVLSAEKNTRYSFPNQEDTKGLALPNTTQANISLSPSLLYHEATGIM